MISASCVNVARGYYRKKNAIPYQPIGVMCDPSLITPDVGSVTIDQCTLGVYAILAIIKI